MINNLIKIKESFNFYLDKCENKTLVEFKRIKKCFRKENIRFENWSMYW